MFNVRPCHWWHVGAQDSVPGVVVNNFSSRKTLNPVANWPAVAYTNRLHAQLSGGRSGEPPPHPRDVVTSLLGALDLEDLVAVYLQDRHNLVLINRGRTSVGYEYVLRDRTSGRGAVATVKSGGATVDLDALPRDRRVDIWAYAVSEGDIGGPRDDVRWIDTDDLVDFITTRPEILPEQVTRWLL